MHRFTRTGSAVTLLMCLVALSTLSTAAFASNSATGTRASSRNLTIWLQTMDSCRQAIPGSKYVLKGNGLNLSAGPAPGTGPKTVGSGNCPIQRGNCQSVATGCVLWTVAVSSTTSAYTITETLTPHNYVPCTGGSVCPGGPAKITLQISPSGKISALVTNTYPDRTTVTWPTSGSYSASQNDPIVVHNFQLGNGSCDGDQDADDHLTGSPGSHCDSDKDRSGAH